MCTIDFLQITRQPVWLIECETPIPAGFPRPNDYQRGPRVDLNALLLPNPDSTYLARVTGNSMDGAPAHIADGALLAIDCSLTPEPGNIVVAAIDGKCTVKRLEKRGAAYWLVPDNPDYEPLDVGLLGQNFEVWGVVTHTVTSMIKKQTQLHRAHPPIAVSSTL